MKPACFSAPILLDAEYGVAGVRDGCGDSCVVDIFRHADYRRAFLVADLGAGYAAESLKRLLYMSLAMRAHHAFDPDCLCHCFFLLH